MTELLEPGQVAVVYYWRALRKPQFFQSIIKNLTTSVFPLFNKTPRIRELFTNCYNERSLLINLQSRALRSDQTRFMMCICANGESMFNRIHFAPQGAIFLSFEFDHGSLGFKQRTWKRCTSLRSSLFGGCLLLSRK